MYPKPNLIIPKTAFAARGFGRRKTGLESDTCCCQALDVTACVQVSLQPGDDLNSCSSQGVNYFQTLEKEKVPLVGKL